MELSSILIYFQHWRLEMKNIVELRQEYDIKQLEKFHKKINNSSLTDEWKLVALATDIYRGRAKDINYFIKMFEAISNRDNQRIKLDMVGDKDASERDIDGNFVYSGVGKTGGLKTFATLSQQADDEAIEKFYDWLKLLRKDMSAVKNKLTVRFDIDWKKAI